MKLKIVACGVFEPYLRRLSEASPLQLEWKVLDAGLHARPHDLRRLAQVEIDSAPAAEGYGAVALLYGLCGRGAAGLVARDVPVVIPRAHDCITLFLGSGEAYLRQFHHNPGTFYNTLGWMEKSTHPRHREAAHLYHDYRREGYDSHPAFERLRDAHGAENAAHILAFHDRWKQHYSRAAYIHLGFDGDDEAMAVSERMAEVNGWRHERIDGDAELLRELAAGAWSDDRFFVLPPGHRSASTGDDRILVGVPIDNESGDGADTFAARSVLAREAGGATPEGVGLGIDAGGTYTDAVIYDLQAREVLAKAKALTTYHDLVIGIREALGQLPPERLARVQVTSLSTTLATNAIVEGRGHRVGLIVLCPWDWFAESIAHEPMVRVPGWVDITGQVMEPLDEAASRAAVRRLLEAERCSAIVVAGYSTTRNPQQANRVRELVLEIADVPVVCAHEVSRRMNAVQGAQTAVANARLLPVIHSLIESVHRALADHAVSGRLMVVKGDGTPVDESVARGRPIETILSGPAASVTGARLLTGLDEAIVIDMGGTTTDCAVLEHGRVAIAEDGARVGDWTVSVDVVDMITVGLGGDSRLDFTRERELTVGPARNIPICCVAAECADVRAFLEGFHPRFYQSAVDASAMDVLVRGAPTVLDLTPRERELLEMVQSGPAPAVEAARRLGMPSHQLLPTGRLEAAGAIKRAALTPTDLLHVTGRFVRWDADAARRALAIFAAMLERPAAQVLDDLLRLVERRIFEELVRREVSSRERRLRDLPPDWRYLLDRAFAEGDGGLGVRFSLRRPVVAIGAPAEVLVAPVRARLDAEVIVPQHADVANAVGAIGTEVVARDEVVIMPGVVSNYVLYGSEERIEFAELRRATERAVQIVRERARAKAEAAGACAPEVTVTSGDRVGSAADGISVFLERRVTAVASGAAFAPSGCR
ncbi:MAG TPA: DUF1638 domain-containing protein [Chthonomonadales bacterium]|nr:DUF1638 domain-containing protein [Chthonomonadales bacterium]